MKQVGPLGASRRHSLTGLDSPWPRWTQARADAGFFIAGHPAFGYCTDDLGRTRFCPGDRGGTLGPGDPTSDPNGAGTTGTAHWLIPEDDSSSSSSADVQALQQRVTDLEALRPRLIDLRGQALVPASAIGSLIEIDDGIELPAANLGPFAKTIDILSVTSSDSTLTGPSSGTLSGDLVVPGLRAATAILLANNSWRVIGVAGQN